MNFSTLAAVGGTFIVITLVGAFTILLTPKNKSLVEKRKRLHERGYNFARTQIIYGGDIARSQLRVIVDSCEPRHVMPFIEGVREATEEPSDDFPEK
jgi:hypothetical protein